MSNIKNEIVKLKNTFTQMKKDNRKNQIDKKSQIEKIYQDIDNLKELQIKDNSQLLEKMVQMDYGDKIQEISKTITENDFKNEFAVTINYFIDEMKKMVSQIDNLRQLQMDNSMRLLYKLDENNYEQQLFKLNKDVEMLNDKIENLNYRQEIENIDKIDNIEYIKNANTNTNVDNVISIETLKENKRKKAKKVFKIDEDINYEELQALSTCVVEFRTNNTGAIAIGN